VAPTPRFVYLTGSAHALDGRYATEFDAMLAAESALAR
jgi:hypothetical protein